MRKLPQSLALLALITGPASSFADALPAEQMLNYFASTCRSQGAWTKAALGKTSAIINILRSVGNAPECQSLAGSIAELDLLQTRIDTISKMNAEDVTLAENRRLEQEILFKMGENSDPQEKSALASQLTTLQLSIATREAGRQARRELNAEDQTRAMSEIAGYVDTVMKQAAASQACMTKAPGLLPAIASLGGAVGATLSSANPAFSLGLAAGTDLLSNVLTSARRWGMHRKIKRFGGTIDHAAFACVIESLATDYCDAEDAIRAIDWKDANRSTSENPPQNSLRAAIRLLERDSPAALAWLQSAKASALVATAADGSRVNMFFIREAVLNGSLPVMQGIFSERSEAYRSTSSPEQKWNMLKPILLQWAMNVSIMLDSSPSGSGGSNPLELVYPGSVGLYYLIGIEQSKIPTANGNLISFNNFDPNNSVQWPGGFGSIISDLDQITTRLTTWITQAQIPFSIERAKFLNPDLLGTLTSAYEPELTEHKISGYEAIQNLRMYFDYRMQSASMSTQFTRLYRDTRDRLKNIEDALQKIQQQDELSQSDLSAIIGTIYTQANLDYGTYFMKGRIDTLLKLAFIDLFTTASPEDRDIAAQTMAAERFMDVLYRVKNTHDLADIRADISTSKSLSGTTLDHFVSTFDKEIERVLRRLKDDEKARGREGGRDSRDLRAKICLNMLTASRWPAKIDRSLCENLDVQLRNSGPRSVLITEGLISAPFRKRSCKMRDLRRDTNIHFGRKN